MSYSETITKADLENVLNEVLPPTPSEYRKLLWTNPNPTNTFSAQTLSLDLSGYDAVDIDIVVSRSSGKMGFCRLLFNAPVSQTLLSLGDDATKHARDVTISTSGITFSDGYYQYMTSGQAKTSDSGQAIPYRIYGVKYDRVAPPQVDASDYIVEEGTDGDWTYRKWNSGVAECWCRVAGGWSVNFTSMTTGVYSATGWNANSKALPTSLFTTVKYANVNVESSGYTSSQLSSLSTATVSFRAWNSYPVNGMTIYAYSLYVKGTWK